MSEVGTKKYFFSGILLVILGTTLFAFKSIFIKLAYAQGLETNSVLMLRMLIALPIYLLMIVWLIKKEPSLTKKIKIDILPVIFLGFIGYFLASWLDLKGLESISAGLERLTLFTYPFFVVLLGALIYNTPMKSNMIIAVILSYIGIGIVFYEQLDYENMHGKGVVFVLLSALSYALYLLLSKNIITRLGSRLFTALAMSISSLFVLLGYMLMFDYTQLIITPKAWVLVTLLALVSTVLPSFMISEAIARIGSAKTGVVGNLGPIITIVLATFILSEPFTLTYGVGAIFVFAGVMLVTLAF